MKTDTRFQLTDKRPKQQQRRQAPHSKHAFNTSSKVSWGKSRSPDAIPGRVDATGSFRGYRLQSTTFAWRSSIREQFLRLFVRVPYHIWSESYHIRHKIDKSEIGS